MSSSTARAVIQQYKKNRKIETISYVVLGSPEAFRVAEARLVIPSAFTSLVLGL